MMDRKFVGVDFAVGKLAETVIWFVKMLLGVLWLTVTLVCP